MAMLKTGLVSISFRDLTINEIIEMVQIARLDSIEWGGDVHVPHGDKLTARKVHQKCELLGIKCPSYGSYYKVGEYNKPVFEFKKVLDSAISLKSEKIRIWAGTRGTDSADKKYWDYIIKELKELCSLAASEGIDVALEYHGKTLTDNSKDTMKLLAKTNMDNLSTYWQPPVGLTYEENLRDIRILKNHISNIHTFTWHDRERMPLSTGSDKWREYFKLVNTWQTRYCMLEFIKDNSIEGFYKDAATLKDLLREYS